ncbi:MAG: hypothetical protein ABIL38_08040 [candidate division WOR-3 bacterium]
MISFLKNQFGKIKTPKGFIFVISFILSISWFADGLIGVIGLILRGWFWGVVALLSIIPPVVIFWIYKKIPKKPVYENALFISTLLTIVLAATLSVLKFYLNWEADNLLPVIQLFLSTGIFTSSWLYIKELDINFSVRKIEPKDVRGLVIFLSYWEGIPNSLCNELCRFKKPYDFYEYLESNKIRCPWEMQLRLIEKIENDGNKLEFVYLIGSKGNKSSHEQISFFKMMVKRFFPDIKIIPYREPVDFEELEDNIKAIKEAFKELRGKGLKDGQIIIDTTGGQKIQSIAGAFYSSTHDRYFAYVSTNTKEVKIFDVILGEGEE